MPVKHVVHHRADWVYSQTQESRSLLAQESDIREIKQAKSGMIIAYVKSDLSKERRLELQKKYPLLYMDWEYGPFLAATGHVYHKLEVSDANNS